MALKREVPAHDAYNRMHVDLGVCSIGIQRLLIGNRLLRKIYGSVQALRADISQQFKRTSLSAHLKQAASGAKPQVTLRFG